MSDEEYEAMKSDCLRAKARSISAYGLYRKHQKEGACPGDLARLRNDYLDKAQIALDLEKRFFPVQDFMDTR